MSNSKFTARLKRSVFKDENNKKRCFLLCSKNFTKLKKKKWSFFLNRKRMTHFFVRNDVHLIHSKILDLRKSYKKGLIQKQKFLIFFSSLKERFIKKLFRYRQDWSILDFIDKIELRLDMVLLRVNVVNSLYSARFFISCKLVYVNGKLAVSSAFRLRVGDLIEIKSAVLRLPFAKTTFAFPPTFLEINYEILSILVLREPSREKLWSSGFFYSFFLGVFDVKNFKKFK